MNNQSIKIYYENIERTGGVLFLTNLLKLTLLLKCFQVFMKLMVPNCEIHHVFCLLSSSKMAFCCKSILFLSYSIPYFLDTKTDVENSRHKSGCVYICTKKITSLAFYIVSLNSTVFYFETFLFKNGSIYDFTLQNVAF